MQQISFEPVADNVSIILILRAIIPKDFISIVRTHFHVYNEVLDCLVKLFPSTNRDYVEFTDMFYDIRVNDELLLAGKNIWLKKRDKQWSLRFISTKLRIHDMTVLEFHDLYDECLIVEKLNTTFGLNHESLDRFEGLQCLASLPTIRMSIDTNSPLTIQLDSVKLGSTQFITVGTFAIRGGYSENSSQSLENVITLLETNIKANVCPSKIIQHYKLAYPELYDRLRRSGVVKNHIDENKLTDHFLISMPITIEKCNQMIQELASAYDDMYGYSSSCEEKIEEEELDE
jgi:hypothetical protein